MNDEQPTLSPDFDLDAWIDGTTGITASARIVQRGDLLVKRGRLEDELRVARKIRLEDRGVGDRTTDTIQDELDAVNEQIYGSMLMVTIQDRTREHRMKVRAAATTAEGISQKDDPYRFNLVGYLAEVADAIIKVETPDGKEIPIGPDGFGWKRLDKILDKCGEASLMELTDRYQEMTSHAPAVQAPFSPSSSSAPSGDISPRGSGRRGSGASRR